MILKTIAVGATSSLLFYCLGCASGPTTQPATTQQSTATPSITQVLPQTITAGSQSMAVKVVGTNFPGQAAILWNGAPVTTTVVDANTLSGAISSSSLATPATVQLQVQNTQTKQSSQAVPLVIAPADSTPSPLTISLTPLPPGVVNAPYSATFSVSGGTAPYTWSTTSGQLPPGLALTASSGTIAGTPTTSGNYSFGITVTDASSAVQSATTTASLTVSTPAAVPLTITSQTLASGSVGAAYANALQAIGGSAPYTWSISAGSLPAGLALVPATGLIDGIPMASGTSNFTVTLADSTNPAQTRSASLSIVVAPSSLAIATSALSSGTSGTSYSALLQASGGSAPYTWSITAGSLPAGLSLAGGAGIISGTPAANGTANFTVTVADAGNPAQTKSVALSIVIAPAALTILSSALPSGTQSTSYSRSLQAIGGTSPYTWSISSGSLPAGLSLAPSTGLISGTPTASGNFTFGVTVNDAGSPAQTASATATLSLVAAGSPLAISSTSLPAGIPNQTYNGTLNATGGTGPYAWSITSGTLPTGLSFAPSSGVISGTPTAVGTASLSFKVTDSSSPAQTKSATLSLVVAPTPLAITTSTMPSGAKGSSYSTLLQASGGTGPYTWSITAGALPAGLTLSTSTGVISGTPTTVGTANFTATAADAGSPAQTKAVSLSIAVTVAPLAIATSSLPSATKGASYSSALQATGGTTPYAWSITAGALPAGLTLSPSTGLISGTPTTIGTSNFTATATDAGSPAQTKAVSLSIAVTVAPLAISTSSLPSVAKGASYSSALQATGGTTPYAWSITAGALPAGLSLSSSTGLISGTPTTIGTSNFTATATDAGSPAQTKSVSLSIVVAVPPLAISTSSLPSATKGASYSNSLQATGGTTPYAWSITGGALPAGVTLASSTGLISGTPTATGTASFTATVTDASSPALTKSVTLSIVAAVPSLAITTSSLPSATNGTAYSNTLAASGGTTPYAWSITGGALPAGLTMAASTGLISGTPTATGTASFTATVTDASSPAQTKSATLSIVVAAGSSALTINATLPAGTANSGYSSAMTATGGTPAYTWSISAGSLPAGLTMAATSGTISGVPTTSGTYNFTATVSDNGSPVQTKSAATSIVVATAAPPPGPGTVWHIRHDGGTNTQCTGTTNAPYPGSGTGVACAYNHPFQMVSYSGTWTSFTAGDTMEFDDPPTNTTPYYMGEQNGGVGMDWQPTLGGICPPPNSSAAAGWNCMLPILPSGITIKGQNYGSCHTAGHTGLINPTVLSGINGVFTVLYVQGTSNVTISCIEVTQPDTCTSAGTGHGPGQCTQSSNYVGYAGLMLEFQTKQGPANMTLTDFAVVGTSNRGIMGSHINLLSTDTFTASDIYLIGNGQAGWDGDGGDCNNSCESVGTMNLSYLDIEWNGCLAVKPYNIGISPETAPNAFNYCYGQNTSGYGDGFVQLAAGNMTMNVTHSMFKYNTQDGFDGAHLSDDPTTSPATNISSSWSEGNAGQTFKIGAGASSTAINNVSISNCHILSNAAAFPNNPSGWVPLDGGDTCRAAGDEWALTLRPNTSIVLENNTSVGYGTVMYDLECSGFVANCDGGTLVFKNNISKGYPDPTNSGQLASGIYFGPGLSNVTVTADHNLWSTMRTGCPDSGVPSQTNYVCADPIFASESNIDAINPSLTPTSPAIGAAISISGITTDYNNVTRPNPPSIGAQEPQSP